MRLQLFLISFFILSTAIGQPNDSVFYFKEVGWTIKLPAGFKIVDSLTRAASVIKGEAMIEKTMKTDIDTANTIHLISASRDKANYFTASLANPGFVNIDNWEETDRLVKAIVYNTLQSQLPKTKIDTSSITETLQQVDFRSFTMDIKINAKVTLHSILLTSFYKDYFFSIRCLYTDDKIGNEIITMLKTSKFE
jgi:hypothetical protein